MIYMGFTVIHAACIKYSNKHKTMLPGVQKKITEINQSIYTLQIGDVLTCKVGSNVLAQYVKYSKILGDTAIKVKYSPTRTIKLFLAEKYFTLFQFLI